MKVTANVCAHAYAKWRSNLGRTRDFGISLYAFVPRKDTNEIAHALIDKFGSLAGVLNADEKRLSEVAGMTQNASLFIACLPEILRRYMQDCEGEKQTLKGRGEIRKFLGNKFYGLREEELYAIALDSRDGLIDARCLAKGSADAVELNVRAIVDFALKTKRAMWLSHTITPAEIRHRLKRTWT